jgi:hypothetical protein
MVTPDMPPFDTQQSAAELREHLSQEQADAIVRADVRATSNLATKADLTNALATLKSDLTAEFHKTINTQTWRYVTYAGVLLAVNTGVVIALIRWLSPTN